MSDGRTLEAWEYRAKCERLITRVADLKDEVARLESKLETARGIIASSSAVPWVERSTGALVTCGHCHQEGDHDPTCPWVEVMSE